MVHDHHVRLGCAAARLEHEAALEVRALEAGAQVRLRRHRVPHLRARLVGEVGEAAVARLRGPRAERLQLRRLPLVEQRLQARARLLQARQAEVVAPTLEQREARRVVARAERAGEDRQVLPDELLLQVDRVGRDDGALAVLARPHEGRDEIGERLPHPGAGLQQRDAAVVVEVGAVRRHVPLAGPVLEAAERARYGAARGEQTRHVDRVEACGGARARAFDHDVEVRDRIVHDPEPDAAVVQPRRHGEVRPRRLEHAARVVVHQHLAAPRDPGKRQHRVHRAARHHARLDDEPVRVGPHHERHLAPARRRDLRPQLLAHRRGEALGAHVLSSRFFAAGNSTLLRMRR